MKACKHDLVPLGSFVWCAHCGRLGRVVDSAIYWDSRQVEKVGSALGGVIYFGRRDVGIVVETVGSGDEEAFFVVTPDGQTKLVDSDEFLVQTADCVPAPWDDEVDLGGSAAAVCQTGGRE